VPNIDLLIKYIEQVLLNNCLVIYTDRTKWSIGYIQRITQPKKEKIWPRLEYVTHLRFLFVSVEDTPYYHSICRYVWREFTCDKDRITRVSFEYKKSWTAQPIRYLFSVFAINFAADAMMSGQFH